MLDLFDSLEREQKQRKKCYQIKKPSGNFGSLCDFVKGAYEVALFDMPSWEDSYCNNIKKRLPQKIINTDVSNLCLNLDTFQNDVSFSDKTGLILSVLMNNSKDASFTLYTDYLKPIHNLGFANQVKVITIKGPAGLGLGYKMQGGSVILYGFAEQSLGSCMTGGEIYLYGEYENISAFLKGGKIYHKGNLIQDGKTSFKE